jgi:hypothetical protein
VARAEAVSAGVVRCEIVPSMTITGCGAPEQTDARVQPDTGVWVAALAVPDLLWGEADFMAAVWQRVNYSDPGIVIQTIDAIHAELRARAGEAA